MLLYVNVKPSQRFNKVERNGSDWVIRLRAPAIDGKANEALVEYMAETLQLSKSKIALVKGHTARVKCLSIDAEAETVLKQLENALN